MKINLEAALGDLEAARQVDQDELVANALFTVGVAYLERGRVEEAAEHLDEAYHLCRKLDNDPGRAQVCLRLAEADYLGGDLGRSEARLREALDLFQAAGEIPGRVSALERLGGVLADQPGRQPEALEALGEAVDLAVGAGDRVAEVLLRQRQAPVLRAQGRREEAVAAYMALGRAAEAVGDRQRMALALVGVGTCLAEAGRLQEGLTALAQAQEVFAGLGMLTRAGQVEQEMVRLAAAGAMASEKNS